MSNFYGRHDYLLIPNYSPNEGVLGLETDPPLSNFVKVVCFFSNYFTQVNGGMFANTNYSCQTKNKWSPWVLCYLFIFFFFFIWHTTKQSWLFFFSPEKITHLWYLGDNIIFHLYMLPNKEGLFYTIVIIFQFEYLVQIFIWRALLPVWTELIRFFSLQGFNLKGKWAQT